MAFCGNCGSRLKDGAMFCHECGSRQDAGAAPPMQQTMQNPPVNPAPAYQAPPPPVAALPASIKFSIEEKEMLKMVKVEMQNATFRCESGAMYYMQGNLQLESKMPSAGGLLKSMVTKETAFKPTISGTGTVYLEPSFGEFTILELKNEQWILDKGAYYASEMGVEVGMWTNKAISGFFSGEGFFQTQVSGTGKVIVVSNGPLEEIILNNDRLVVDGSFAVARTAGIDFTVNKATKGLFSSWTSGEGIVNTFTGTGKVLIAPAANRYITLTNYLGSIYRRVIAIKNN
ncbi:MAG: zinc-ribbon domain-containing protein [Lentimicrobium sp.]|nr:zinc-ribbon domain-containing protein [Lentimicrobium sp.]